jgi:hypothetical protein
VALRISFGSQKGAGVVIGAIAGLVVPIIGEAIASGATAFAVSAVHLNKTISIAETYGKLKASFASILWTVALVNLRALWVFALAGLLGVIAAATIPPLIILAFLTLLIAIVVACVAYCFYALAVPACAVEHLSAKQSLSRSRFLTDGIGKQIVVIYVLGWIISMVVNAILQAPQSAPPRFGHPALFTGFAKDLWANISLFVATALAGPVKTISFSVLYFDQRVRKEAFDLDLMIEALESNRVPHQAEGRSASQ